MVGRRLPGEFEQVVLLALAGFDGHATPRDVYDAIVSMTGRDVAVAAIHITLGRLTEKRWVDCETRAPEPHQGGKPRKRYVLAEGGAAVLTEQRAQLDRLWGRAIRHPLFGGGS